MPPSRPDHAERLRSPREIAAARRRGARRVGRRVVVHDLRSRHEGPPRLAVIASRSVGGAVARNRAKRLLREAGRRVAWSHGHDVVLVARAAIVGAGMHEVLDELRDLVAPTDLGAA